LWWLAVPFPGVPLLPNPNLLFSQDSPSPSTPVRRSKRSPLFPGLPLFFFAALCFKSGGVRPLTLLDFFFFFFFFCFFPLWPHFLNPWWFGLAFFFLRGWRRVTVPPSLLNQRKTFYPCSLPNFSGSTLPGFWPVFSWSCPLVFSHLVPSRPRGFLWTHPVADPGEEMHFRGFTLFFFFTQVTNLLVLFSLFFSPFFFFRPAPSPTGSHNKPFGVKRVFFFSPPVGVPTSPLSFYCVR